MQAVRCLLAMMALALSAPAWAQVEPPPVRSSIDQNGVDLVRGTFTTSMTDVSIGSADHGMAFTRRWSGHGWWNSLTATITGSSANPVVTTGNGSDSFTWNGSRYSANQGNGATLTLNAGVYDYTARDGMVVHFAQQDGTTPYRANYANNLAFVTSMVFVDGTRWSFNYAVDSYCSRSKPGGDGDICMITTYLQRLTSVSSNFGYRLILSYPSDELATTTPDEWLRVTRITAVNTTVCDPAAAGCLTGHAWPHADYSNGIVGVTDMTDPQGRTWHYSYGGDGLTGLRRPGAGSDDVTIAYNGSRVSSVTKAGVAWTYAYSMNGTALTTTVTGPNGVKRTATSDQSVMALTDDMNGVSANTHYEYDFYQRLFKVTAPEGNSVEYTYDDRGNVTNTTLHAKPGSGAADIVTTAGYPADCPNPRTCNQPAWTRDASQRQTDYEYHSNIGRLARITAPAGANGIRPLTRYDYVNIDGAGPSGIWLPVLTRSCRTQQTCDNTADETRASIGYGNASQNYLPLSTLTIAGDNSVGTTSAATYDAIGNVASVTDPNGQTRYMYYNADRQPTWSVSADPDDGGPLKRRAIGMLYRADGTLDFLLTGTADPGTPSPAPPNWGELQRVGYDYDSYGRRVSATLRDGGGTNAFALTQWGYDNEGRSSCTAVRMNPNAWATLPEACTQSTQGPDGPDRITKLEYDAADYVRGQWSGWGTPEQANVSTVYSANGKVVRIDDQKAQSTAYAYDGFDRPGWTCYGVATCTGSDYEQVAYDGDGNVVNRRMRDGNVWSYGYDGLGRLTRATPPMVDANDRQVDYSWDNAGHMTRAHDTHFGNDRLLSYDALGRVTSESGAFGTTAFGYDAAGQLRSLDYGDGFRVTYDWYNTGEMHAAYENGGTQLFGYAYDDLGRKVALGRANGATTGWAYDGGSRLVALSQGAGGANVSFGYGYDAAGRIKYRGMSNGDYAWASTPGANRGYQSDALNRYTAITGTSAPAYDTRGNMTAAGLLTAGAPGSYGYNAENRLVRAGDASNWFYYDAIGRLTYEAATCTFFDHAGDRLLEEVDCGDRHLKARYVYGDEAAPLVQYDGTGQRRWLHADERGSVITLSDDTGGAVTINSYDEHGVPGGHNQGRFQYTGQAWLPTLGMYYYKARVYSPTLGRFLQTDPIGYGDGLNWYNYGGEDPVNNVDPTGLQHTGEAITGSLFTAPGGGIAAGSAGVSYGYSSDNTLRVRYSYDASLTNGITNFKLTILTAPAGSIFGSFSSALYGQTLGQTADSPQNADAALTSKQIDEIVVTAARSHQVGGVKIDFSLSYPQEQLWVMYGATDFSYLGINGKAKGNTGENRGTPPRPGYQAIIHTHPSWAEYGPGPKDFGYPVPLYGIAPDGVWVVRPGATSATGLYGLRP